MKWALGRLVHPQRLSQNLLGLASFCMSTGDQNSMCCFRAGLTSIWCDGQRRTSDMLGPLGTALGQLISRFVCRSTCQDSAQNSHVLNLCTNCFWLCGVYKAEGSDFHGMDDGFWSLWKHGVNCCSRGIGGFPQPHSLGISCNWASQI